MPGVYAAICCGLKSMGAKPAMTIWLSTVSAVLKAQQEPHWPCEETSQYIFTNTDSTTTAETKLQGSVSHDFGTKIQFYLVFDAANHSRGVAPVNGARSSKIGRGLNNGNFVSSQLDCLHHILFLRTAKENFEFFIRPVAVFCPA